MENNKVEIVVEDKKNFIQKIGNGISKAGDKLADFSKKHEVGIKRAKAAATVIGGAAVLGLVIGGKRKSKEAIDCEYEEVPTTEEALQQLEEMETEVEESEKEETEEE